MTQQIPVSRDCKTATPVLTDSRYSWQRLFSGMLIGFVGTATMSGMALGGWLYDQTGSYFVAFVNGIGWNLVNIVLIGLLFIRIQSGRRQRSVQPGMS
jgi:hypothetical protein